MMTVYVCHWKTDATQSCNPQYPSEYLVEKVFSFRAHGYAVSIMTTSAHSNIGQCMNTILHGMSEALSVKVSRRNCSDAVDNNCADTKSLVIMTERLNVLPFFNHWSHQIMRSQSETELRSVQDSFSKLKADSGAVKEIQMWLFRRLQKEITSVPSRRE